jgi:hypothetical protein
VNVRRILLLTAVVALLADRSARAVPAFSGAEGFGAITQGGAGGAVLHVTNLNDSGTGSLRAALEANGPRTIVFDVAGQINLTSEIAVLNPYLTIAGETAPGGGITVAGETVSLDTHDVILRHLRLRRGNTTRADDSLGSDRTNGNYLQDKRTGHIIIDHVSASWGLDENMSVYRNKLDASLFPGSSTVFPTRNVTIQWSISSEALNPNSHAFGSTLGGAGVNQHHNLWASNTARNPSISFSHFMDFRNNVLFNWQHRSVDGAGPEAHVNMINNYYKPGPATNSGQLQYRIVKPELRNGVVGPGEAGWWYVEGNFVQGNAAVTANNWNGGVQFDLPGMQQSWVRVNSPHTHVDYVDDPDDPFDDDGSGPLPGSGNPIPIQDLPMIATQSALDAYQSVLAGAGASLFRDAVDLRVTNMVATGVVSGTANGIIVNPSQVGGYPVIPFVECDANWDTDQDGMPNHWEEVHGLNSHDAADRLADFDADGYDNLRDYLNEVGAFPAVKEIVWDNSLGNGRYAQIENWDIAFQPSRFDTAVIHNGTVTVDAVGQHSGTLQIAPNAADNATLNIASGKLRVSTLTKGANGIFNLTGGTLSADEVQFDLVNNGGTIAPGDSPGTTRVVGDLDLESGVLEIEIAGTQPGIEYDRIEVSGHAELGGVLDVKLLDGFVPNVGDVFGFLFGGGGFSGMFDEIMVPNLGPGKAWALNPGGATVFLYVVTAPIFAGDFDNDGDVDGRDFLIWQRGGSPSPLSAGDLADWRANYGTGSLSANSSAVPEPGTSIMLLSALCWAIMRVR